MIISLASSHSCPSRPSASVHVPFGPWTALVIVVSMLAVAGCGSEETPKEVTRHENVRGLFLGTASDGRDIVIHHEAVAGAMPPMIMSLPVARPGAADSINVDQPVQFDLVIEGSEIRVENLRALPDTTTLDLGSPPQNEEVGYEKNRSR